MQPRALIKEPNLRCTASDCGGCRPFPSNASEISFVLPSVKSAVAVPSPAESPDESVAVSSSIVPNEPPPVAPSVLPTPEPPNVKSSGTTGEPGDEVGLCVGLLVGLMELDPTLGMFVGELEGGKKMFETGCLLEGP